MNSKMHGKDEDAQITSLLDEFFIGRRSGKQLPVEKFVALHPDCGEQLRAELEGELALLPVFDKLREVYDISSTEEELRCGWEEVRRKTEPLVIWQKVSETLWRLAERIGIELKREALNLRLPDILQDLVHHSVLPAPNRLLSTGQSQMAAQVVEVPLPDGRIRITAFASLEQGFLSLEILPQISGADEADRIIEINLQRRDRAEGSRTRRSKVANGRSARFNQVAADNSYFLRVIWADHTCEIPVDISDLQAIGGESGEKDAR